MLQKRQAKVLFDLWFWILWFEGVPEVEGWLQR